MDTAEGFEPDEAALLPVIGRAISETAGHHPGVIAEAVVARILATFQLTPRELWHRERRRNHEERVRRLSHEVYRLLESARGGRPEREIAARVAKAFVLTAKPPAGGAAGQTRP